MSKHESMADLAAIEFKDVSFSYGDHVIIDKANALVNPNEFVAIVGPNGSGKTTLLKLMLGILKPSHGKVTIFGKRPEKARSFIGYMPQHAHLDPKFPISVLDVALMGRLRGFSPIFGYSKKDIEIVEETLARLGMWEHRRAHFSELSGGQRQRVLISRALAVQPKLLLLDEPTAGLDCVVEEELLALLDKLAQSVTVVQVSHELTFVSKYMDKVICVKTSVQTHPTSEINTDILNELYGPSIRQIRHDISGNGGSDFC